MTTQTLAQAITLRRELPLEDLLKFAPQLAGYAFPHSAPSLHVDTDRVQSRAEQAFWSTFAFGCLQSAVLFSLIYAYFAL